MMKKRQYSTSILFLLLVMGLFSTDSHLTQAQEIETHLEFVFNTTTWGESPTLLKVDLTTGEITPFVNNNYIYVIEKTWSPNGMWLAGLATYDLSEAEPSHFDVCIFDAVGNTDVCFEAVAKNRPIAWTPNSESILFVSDLRDNTLFISRANLSDETIQPVLEIPWDEDLIRVMGPYWTPNANRFAVGIEIDEDPKPEITRVSENTVYIVDIETGSTTMLDVHVDGLAGLSWSSDGRYLTLGASIIDFDSASLIYDTESRETIHPKLVHEETHILGFLRSWSNEGHKLAFFGYGYKPDADLKDLSGVEEPQLFIYDLEFNSLQAIEYHNWGILEHPQWSPDDQFLVFVATKGHWGTSEIVVASLDGQVQIFKGSGAGNREPVWRPTFATP